MRKRFDDGDDAEKTFNFSDGEGGAEGAQSGSGLTAEDLLRKQQQEQADIDQHTEDRGDNFEPDDVVQPAEVNGDLLDDMAGILGEDDQLEGKEDKGAVEGEDKQQAPKPPIMIPKARFDEVSQKMKNAAAENNRLRQQLAAMQPAEDGEPFDFDAAEKRYMDALTEEGDQEKALEIRREIRNAEKAMYQKTTVGTVQATNVQAQAEDTFQTVVASAIELYPFLDSTNKEAANTDAIEMVVALRDKYTGEGKSDAVALQLAVEKVGPMYSKVQADAPEKGKTEAEQRQEDAMRRNAAASRQQPANLARFGEQAGKTTINVAEMSERDFDNLPEEEKARLRGDYV